ncbi:hypothetical protein OG599_15350 [Streptomyces sp. NBC_01335]|uniref:hypothetical protein n=1 Tax=Streptomyces sp. NBC_01335 TaxID=2903828 RepID=UPI002E12FE61|nr:hypothetical protein OG599_15350 [Streptomyces sp. NBC_01335]
MRAATVRRSALAASVASLVLLVTACGGSSDESDSADKATGSSKSSASASAGAEQAPVKALTAAELEKAALVQGDVADLKIEKAAGDDIVEPEAVTVDKAACLPFAQALFAAAQGKPVASTSRSVESEAKTTGADATSDDAAASVTGGDHTELTLSSYEGTGAADVLAAVRTAATACASGFSVTVSGDAQKISGITEEKVTGGEEQAAWTMAVEQEGMKVPFDLAVVRQGSTVSTFTTLNVTAFMGKKVKLTQPQPVIDAQVKKLG